MASYKTKGIIIRRTEYQEADRIYSILTVDHGVVEAMAKGVRKATSKLSPHLELFGEIELMFAAGKSLDIITSARLLRSFSRLSQDYELMKRGFLFCEMINKLAKLTASASTYHLLVECLEGLDAQLSASLVELYFKLRLVDQLGYKPNLEQTIQNHAEIVSHKQYAFSSEGGGLVEKTQAHIDHPHISGEHIKLWRLILRHPLDQIAKIKNTQVPAQESLPIANEFYDYLFGKRFKSSEI